ncbi:MAG: hypothetical protein SynsKO_13550 [Synoicihabitans sp.]
MSDETEFQSSKGAAIAGAIGVGVIFLYLQTFGGRVMLELGQEIADADETWRYRGMSTLMVLGGVLGALVAAMRFRLEVWQTNLGWSFRACAVAAVFAVVAQNWTTLLGAAFLAGIASGWVLTTLATGMRSSVGTKHLGFVVGGGLALSIGLGQVAYLLADLFGDSTKGTAVVIAMLAAATSVVVPFLTPLEPSMDMTDNYRGKGLFATWLAFFAIAVLANLYASASGIDIAGIGPMVVGICVLPGLGWLLDGGQRGVQLLAAGGVVIGGMVALVGLGYLFSILTLLVTWMSLLGFYFAARGGRVWVSAGTVVWVWILAPYVAEFLT